MKKLKDYFVSDLDNVFFNTEEFATLANVDGREMKVIVNNEMLAKYNFKNDGEGLNSGKLLFIVRKSEFPYDPIIGNRMKFDGDPFTILDFTEDAHTYTITLEDRRS